MYGQLSAPARAHSLVLCLLLSILLCFASACPCSRPGLTTFYSPSLHVEVLYEERQSWSWRWQGGGQGGKRLAPSANSKLTRREQPICELPQSRRAACLIVRRRSAALWRDGATLLSLGKAVFSYPIPLLISLKRSRSDRSNAVAGKRPETGLVEGPLGVRVRALFDALTNSAPLRPNPPASRPFSFVLFYPGKSACPTDLLEAGSITKSALPDHGYCLASA